MVKLQNRLGRKLYSFDLLSGFSCPFAKACLSKAVDIGGTRKIQDGPHTEHRCFSASQEVFYTNLYNLRQHNFKTLQQAKTTNKMVELLSEALPSRTEIVRIHVAGDFFNRNYFHAWIKMAEANPNILFYAYTKSLAYYAGKELPLNLLLTASYGGTQDNLIWEHDLRYAKVVFTEQEALDNMLEIDHDDFHAASDGPSFALLIHGIQPAGSEAGKAMRLLRGKGSYSRKAA